MFDLRNNELPPSEAESITLEDYNKCDPRWCDGCGDFAILTAVQRVCRDEQLPLEKTMFVSGIGCSSRFPHYMNTYGFHSLHGRALPIAQGIKLRRPDLKVFVNTGDGDCCSIGTAHWIHAIRNNMDMTVLLHDNEIYGLTKKQMSPTTPAGVVSNTSPTGSYLEPLNPLTVTLGIANVSFVAQAADWMPGHLYDVLYEAYRHKGLSFVRILQRCPQYVPNLFDPWITDPDKILILEHENGVRIDAGLAGTYKNRTEHDPIDMNRARELASSQDPMPVGILYRNEEVPCYEDIRQPEKVFTPVEIEEAFEKEMDQFSVKIDD